MIPADIVRDVDGTNVIRVMEKDGVIVQCVTETGILFLEMERKKHVKVAKERGGLNVVVAMARGHVNVMHAMAQGKRDILDIEIKALLGGVHCAPPKNLTIP